MSEVKGFRDYRSFKIYINDLLHVELTMDNHDSMYSWIEGSHRKEFFIEFYRKQGSPVKLEYNDESLWKNILRIIDKYI